MQAMARESVLQLQEAVLFFVMTNNQQGVEERGRGSARTT